MRQDHALGCFPTGIGTYRNKHPTEISPAYRNKQLGPKKSKSAYIRRRVKLVAGKSVADALTAQVPDKDGAMGPYKKSDFKYDVKSGFLVF